MNPLPMRLLILIVVVIYGCGKDETYHIADHYSKMEYRIPMRDGKTLFTAVFTPKDSSERYPILFTRTPYSIAPYGNDSLPAKLGPSPAIAKERYIFVYQDVRGKFMSEGEYVNVRPYNPGKQSPEDIDESSDTYDTIEWLLQNIQHHNGKVGMWGISYPGFYTAMGLIDAHPALKAASPQAPIADWFIGDDMHQHGAFSLTLTFNFFATFGKPRPQLTKKWPPRFDHGTPDGYQFFLQMGPLPMANEKYFHHEIEFWNKTMEHGTYDDFWKARNILPHLNTITPAVLVVGGWYDAEDLYGSLQVYRAIEHNNPNAENFFVMGPWFHGGWARSAGDSLGPIAFGSKTSEYYQNEVELPFFNHYLKDQPGFEPIEARVFDTGSNQWHNFDEWPLTNLQQSKLYLQPGKSLSFESPVNSSRDLFEEYVSDPWHPVPFTAEITNRWTREYMVEDQRFASRRPDVVTYTSEILSEPVTIAGPIMASLYVSTSGTDADWIVKLIDVYPDSFPDPQPNPCNIRMGGYQRLIRAGIMRGKFRDSYEHPQPFVPNRVTRVEFPLNDILHTFKAGHKIMVQIQSSWFPLFDRNPQKFVDIYRAREEDFQKALQRIYHSAQWPSHLKVNLLQ